MMKPVFMNRASLKYGVFNTGFSRNRVWIGLYLKVLSSLRIFEVGGQNQISAEFVLRQVDRLTGARTRRELMIGAELGSSD
ncbi:hypothetical protein QL285_087306 [Trifolium repens]|nr:hypothetical protein QL285_087306 [Trifolium repens]